MCAVRWSSIGQAVTGQIISAIRRSSRHNDYAPPYLARFVPSTPPAILGWVFHPAEAEAGQWLAWAVDRAQGWACSDAELIGRLDADLAGAKREETLRE